MKQVNQMLLRVQVLLMQLLVSIQRSRQRCQCAIIVQKNSHVRLVITSLTCEFFCTIIAHWQGSLERWSYVFVRVYLLFGCEHG